MTEKEKFLEIKSYDEWLKRKSEFANIDYRDKAVIDHLSKICGKINDKGAAEQAKKGIIVDVFNDNPRKE